MTGDSKNQWVIRCPGCGGPSVYAVDNPHRPFCSARCKNNDFGAWANESYTVPTQPDMAQSDDEAGGTETH